MTPPTAHTGHFSVSSISPRGLEGYKYIVMTIIPRIKKSRNRRDEVEKVIAEGELTWRGTVRNHQDVRSGLLGLHCGLAVVRSCFDFSLTGSVTFILGYAFSSYGRTWSEGKLINMPTDMLGNIIDPVNNIAKTLKAALGKEFPVECELWTSDIDKYVRESIPQSILKEGCTREEFADPQNRSKLAKDMSDHVERMYSSRVLV